MPISALDYRNSRRRRPAAPPAPARVERQDHAFLVENPETNRIVITTPLHEAANLMSPSNHMLQLSGRLVEGEQANRNGAFWSQGDLEFGLPSVGHGPLNWLHEEKSILGTLMNPRLISQADAQLEDPRLGPYIKTDSVVWSWIYPEESAAIARHVEQETAWMSMECVAQSIECVGPNGCGHIASYGGVMGGSEKACEHITYRTAARRLINPTFLGAAVILPPSAPGWGNATLTGRSQADHVVEAASSDDSLAVPGLKPEEVSMMLAKIMDWSGRAKA